MSLAVDVLKLTSLNRSPVLATRCHQQRGMGGLRPGDPCSGGGGSLHRERWAEIVGRSLHGEVQCTDGTKGWGWGLVPCMVRSIASWLLVTWDSELRTKWHTWLEILPSRNLIDNRSQPSLNQSRKKSDILFENIFYCQWLYTQAVWTTNITLSPTRWAAGSIGWYPPGGER